MKRFALLQVVEMPKQKQGIHSSGVVASSLKEPSGQTDPVLLTKRMVSGIAKVEPRLFNASQL